MNGNDISLRDLARMWEAKDPMPDGLVEKVLVALATEDLDAEYELLHLVERSRDLQGTRGHGEAFTIAFSGGAFSLLIRVSELSKKHCRVDGWVTPAQSMRVRITQKENTQEAIVDARGRFEIRKLPTGLTRFWLRSDDQTEDAEGLFATPTFEL
jgi:hypothetical protein